jgi:hypothetical protein
VAKHHLNARTGANKKYFNKTLTSYSTPVEGDVIKATMGGGKGFHYCGMSLKVWKSQGATVCLSCLPRFNEDQMQASQMTGMANIMGFGLWTESGVPNLAGFSITNQTGPTVDVFCESLTVGSLTMHYTIRSYLYWPSTVFAQTFGPFLNQDHTSSLYGITHAYTIQLPSPTLTSEQLLSLISIPDNISYYHYVLVEVTSSSHDKLKLLSPHKREDDHVVKKKDGKVIKEYPTFVQVSLCPSSLTHQIYSLMVLCSALRFTRLRPLL